jgi:tetratricopeptide (TPR) repeat protein
MWRPALLRICAAALSFALAAPALWGQSPRQGTIQEHYQTAQEALRQNRYDEAASQFLEILRLNPKLAEAHANLGVVYYIQGKYSEASQAFQQSLKLKPTLSKAENFLGLIKARTGHIDEALPLLEKSFKNPADDEWRQQTGLLLIEIYSSKTEFDRALDVVRTLEKTYPSNPEILYVAYRIYSELGAKAVSALVRAAPNSGASGERR